MSTVKYYHVTEKGLEEGEALGRINVVLKSDYDSLKADLTNARQCIDMVLGLIRAERSGSAQHVICTYVESVIGNNSRYLYEDLPTVPLSEILDPKQPD